LDVWALASKSFSDQIVQRKRVDKSFIAEKTTEFGAKIAILYKENIPDEWIECGSWDNPVNIVAAHNSVYFYAVDSLSAATLVHNLKLMEGSLPDGVISVINEF
jgi:hypothetical protein